MAQTQEGSHQEARAEWWPAQAEAQMPESWWEDSVQGPEMGHAAAVSWKAWKSSLNTPLPSNKERSSLTEQPSSAVPGKPGPTTRGPARSQLNMTAVKGIKVRGAARGNGNGYYGYWTQRSLGGGRAGQREICVRKRSRIHDKDAEGSGPYRKVMAPCPVPSPEPIFRPGPID